MALLAGTSYIIKHANAQAGGVPQQYANPSVPRPHVKAYPPATSVKVWLVRTATGTVE